MMYEQQLNYLPAQSMDNLIDIIENKLKPKRFAVILHDKDIDEQGQPKEPHIHAMMSFDNAHSLNSVARQLGDKPQYIEAWKGNSNNGYAYLTHQTADAKDKYQYNPNDVIASFDYPALLKQISAEVAEKNSKSVKMMLDLLYSGSISKEELEQQLTGSQYGRYKNQIENVYAKRLKNEAARFRKEMIEQGKAVQVIWIYGESGTGKTSLAKEYAMKANQSYYISGSSRDVFQNYNGEHTLILDELRPKDIEYHDLLRILDPFGQEKSAPSRYHDKELACDLIIITTPFNPLKFYYEIFGDPRYLSSWARQAQKTDSFGQLLRRITLIIEMSDARIDAMEYNAKFSMFDPIPNAGKLNPYSSYRRTQTNTIDKVQLFNSVFD